MTNIISPEELSRCDDLLDPNKTQGFLLEGEKNEICSILFPKLVTTVEELYRQLRFANEEDEDSTRLIDALTDEIAELREKIQQSDISIKTLIEENDELLGMLNIGRSKEVGTTGDELLTPPVEPQERSEIDLIRDALDHADEYGLQAEFVWSMLSELRSEPKASLARLIRSATFDWDL